MVYFKDCIIFLLAKGNQKAQKNLKTQLKIYGLTPVQALVLGALEEEDGLTTGELGKRLGLDNATISGVLDRLLEHNHIIKTIDDKDKRVHRIFLHNNIDEKMINNLYRARNLANEKTMEKLSMEERILLKRLLKDLV